MLLPKKGKILLCGIPESDFSDHFTLGIRLLTSEVCKVIDFSVPALQNGWGRSFSGILCTVHGTRESGFAHSVSTSQPHESPSAVQDERQQIQVIVSALPATSSGKVQLLYVGGFGPFKEILRNEVWSLTSSTTANVMMTSII